MRINLAKYYPLTFFLKRIGIVLCCLMSFEGMAQKNKSDEQDKVTLERAEVLEKNPQNPHVRKLVRMVIMRHKGTTLYCDSAYQYENKNAVVAFGNVRLQGEDGTSVSADSMSYDGDTQIARAIGKKVVLIDQKMQLTTKQLDYDVANGLAHYYNGGEIIDTEKNLKSLTGTYDTNSKIFYFRQNVELISNKDGQTIHTENLTYNTISKLAFFQGPTKIKSKDGDVFTTNGTYNTETGISHFKGRTTVEDENYLISGDTLYFERQNEIGFAQGNVFLKSKKDSVIVEGDFGWLRGKEGESKIYGNTLMQSISNDDTLFVRADTMYSIQKKDKSTRLLLAYPNTRIYQKEIQGKCDSLSYNRNDSTMRFYRNPILWNKNTQMLADTIITQIANNQIELMFLRSKAFLISQDTLKRYNQLKGKNMKAFFKKNQIRKLEVRGNAENIYFVLEKDSVLVGMNRIECSDMDVRFKEQNKIHTIAYINQAEANFVPPHELQEPQTKLKDFRWLVEQRPLRKDMRREEVLVKIIQKE